MVVTPMRNLLPVTNSAATNSSTCALSLSIFGSIEPELSITKRMSDWLGTSMVTSLRVTPMVPATCSMKG